VFVHEIEPGECLDVVYMYLQGEDVVVRYPVTVKRGRSSAQEKERGKGDGEGLRGEENGEEKKDLREEVSTMGYLWRYRRRQRGADDKKDVRVV